MIRSVTILGKKWKVSWASRLKDALASCSSPDLPNRKITLRRSLLGDDEKLIDCMVHEMMHASQWNLDEGFVEEFATDVARALVRLGFHRGDRS